MPQHNQLHRYLFEQHAVRGELVTLTDTLQQILTSHDYPQPVQTLLAEMLAATCLLTATLKFDGDITVQLQGDGPLSLAVINGNNRQEMRGIARLQGHITEAMTLHQMLGNGYLVITITPQLGERYQGVVALEGEAFSDLLENYFRQSEQLPTQLFIRHGSDQAKPAVAGMLLQVLPNEDRATDSFNHLAQLTSTVKADELLTLPANDVLYRLYHQEEVTLFGAQNVRFRCTCSRERTAEALRSISASEREEIFAAEGHIDMHCDYCGTHYLFERGDLR